MLARLASATPWGVDARSVLIEVDVRNGRPWIEILGLSGASARESRERVRAALRSSGFELRGKTVVVNLAPLDLRKEPGHLDLGVALALLSALGKVPAEALGGRLVCGELGLDGAMRPVRGALALAELAASEGLPELIVPTANASEAGALGGVRVIPVRSLSEAVDHLLARSVIPAAPALEPLEPVNSRLDLSEVRGNEIAKRALELAAAGSHNLLMIGPPGSGKTMLARRLPGILPPLSRPQQVAVTKIHSRVGEQPPTGLITQPPFRCPHPSVSTAGLLGGGPHPRPGELSLAHGGVLFLDELPEFRRDALSSLRQPLEEGEVAVVRSCARVQFPASFILLAAMAPCPCGHLGDPRHECRCTPQLVERYRSRIFQPLLERIDIHVEVPPLSLLDLKGPPGETSAEVAQRVLRAREAQQERFGGTCSTPTNAAMSEEGVLRHAVPDTHALRLLDTAFERLKLSARGVARILRVARTIADLDGIDEIRSAHVAEAIGWAHVHRPRAGATA
ncbi:MAG: YifB family Mg chelatase-like AAA ATPase [bacterium]|nr:YifB family Mg chelatase-like AAA ATPase [bacterium]